MSDFLSFFFALLALSKEGGGGGISQQDLEDYAVAISQGAAHAGEFLVVGDDGNIVTKAFDTLEGGSY